MENINLDQEMYLLLYLLIKLALGICSTWCFVTYVSIASCFTVHNFARRVFSHPSEPIAKWNEGKLLDIFDIQALYT